MNAKQATTWIWGAVVIALLIVAAAWFALLSPVRSSTADLRLQTEALQSANEQKEVRIARLAKEAEGLDTLKADLASLRSQVPADAAMAEYLRELQAVADAHSVTIVSISPAEPTVFAPAGPETTTQTSVEGAGVPDTANDGSADAGGTTATAPATTAPTTGAPAGMVAIPVAFDVVGTYADALAFLDTLQQQTHRLALVTAVAGVGLEDAEASGGRPASSVGDVELTLTGTVFVLPDVPVPAAGADVDAPLPGEVPGKNPLIPIG